MKGKSVLKGLILLIGLLCTWFPIQAGELNETTKAGDVVKMRQLLEQGADINAVDKNGMTPAKVAIWQKHPQTSALIHKFGGK